MRSSLQRHLPRAIAFEFAIATLLIVGVGQAQMFERRVALALSGGSAAEDQVASEVRRGLRSLSGVTLAEPPDDRVEVIVADLLSTGGQRFGLAAAVVITSEPLDMKDFWNTLGEAADCKFRDDFGRVQVGIKVMDRVSFRSFTLLIGPDDPNKLASRIVAYVDNQAIEPARKIYEEIRAKRQAQEQ